MILMREKCLFFTFAIIAALLSVSAGNAPAKIYIDVDAPNFQLFPIAVTDFNLKDNETAKKPDAGVVLADEVKKYLAMTGFFNPLNKKSFLEEKTSGTPAADIDFSNWAMIGADYLLKGRLTLSDREMIAECSLFDVIRGELVFGKKYAASNGDQLPLARSIASDILFTLTGDAGEFNTRIAFVAKKGSKGDIYIESYDGLEQKAATNHRSIILSPRWSPDGRFLAFTSFKNGHPGVYIKDLTSGSERKVTSYEGLNLCGYWSPDGKQLLLTLSKDGNEEIYALEVDTLRLKRLTNSYSIDVSPSWSPDGKRIAFVSNRGGSPQIYIMDSDGNNVKRITFEGNYNTSPSWSPRGGRIAYEGLVNRKFQIFTIDEEGNNLVQLTFDGADNESPSWSPSGRQIVYSSNNGSKSRISIMNANGLNARVLVEAPKGLAMPMWSPRFR
jgi:TolB protein